MTKSEHIRACMKEQPDVGAADIVQILAAKGVQVSVATVYKVRRQDEVERKPNGPNPFRSWHRVFAKGDCWYVGRADRPSHGTFMGGMHPNGSRNNYEKARALRRQRNHAILLKRQYLRSQGINGSDFFANDHGRTLEQFIADWSERDPGISHGTLARLATEELDVVTAWEEYLVGVIARLRKD